MLLTDYDIENLIKNGRLKIEPFDIEIVRENGIDARLADEVARHKEDKDLIFDPYNDDISKVFIIEKGLKEIILKPKEQVLLSTIERIEMPDDVAALVELRSTWARHGLSMPPTVIDAGFKGTVTLEVVNNAPYAIKLLPGSRFAHIIFIKASNRVIKTYNGRYQDQKGVQLPKKP
ncbi:MAG: deoxycytidine triphosphate deaminase [Candidatus Micrarchaeota archaeon]|nr:MAG: deoxycytidine triphosphate deaminase [Candidatus Micrarchaeota archaeon]